MGEQGFYAVLPSNASTNIFPLNNQHTFKIKIPSSLPISKGKWLVGLTEIQFPTLWKNLKSAYVCVKYDNQSNPLKCNLHDGIYDTIDDLLIEIKYALQSVQLENDIVLKYDKIRNRVIMKIQNKSAGFGISFSQNLLNMLGFIKEEGEFYQSGTYVEKAADITEGFSALYIYSDIVESRLVGDSMANLIRVVPIERQQKSSFSGVHWVRFQNIQYIPVNKTHTDLIKIHIRRDNGEKVSFESGKVVLTLHFREI